MFYRINHANSKEIIGRIYSESNCGKHVKTDNRLEGWEGTALIKCENVAHF